MSAARNLFDLKIDLKEFAGRVQNAQSHAKTSGPMPSPGKATIVIGLFCHDSKKKLTISDALMNRQTHQRGQYRER
jgi:hypothetical protein